MSVVTETALHGGDARRERVLELAPQRIQNVICARRDMSWEFPAL